MDFWNLFRRSAKTPQPDTNGSVAYARWYEDTGAGYKCDPALSGNLEMYNVTNDTFYQAGLAPSDTLQHKKINGSHYHYYGVKLDDHLCRDAKAIGRGPSNIVVVRFDHNPIPLKLEEGPLKERLKAELKQALENIPLTQTRGAQPQKLKILFQGGKFHMEAIYPEGAELITAAQAKIKTIHIVPPLETQVPPAKNLITEARNRCTTC